MRRRRLLGRGVSPIPADEWAAHEQAWASYEARSRVEFDAKFAVWQDYQRASAGDPGLDFWDFVRSRESRGDVGSQAIDEELAAIREASSEEAIRTMLENPEARAMLDVVQDRLRAMRAEGTVLLVRRDGHEGERVHVRGANVCTTCSEIRGQLTVSHTRGEPDPGTAFDQLCRCQRETQHQDRWPDFDFNTYLELCYCCGFEPVPSGSRWSGFFCAKCGAWVAELNAHYGRLVCPVGRHSLMHGDLVREEELPEFFEAIEILREFAAARVHTNLESLDLASAPDVALGSYMNAAYDRFHKTQAFNDLRLHMLRERFGL
jgi:hypothetical protein